MIKSLSGLLKNFDSAPKERSKNYRKKRGAYEPEVFDFLSLIKFWPEIIGPKLAKHTIPIKNKNKTLYIMTAHSAFSEQLSFMEANIKNKIFKKFPNLRGTIKSLYFQTNPAYFENKPTTIQEENFSVSGKEKTALHPFSPEYKRLKSMADDQFADIEDGEIKESLTSIFIQNSNKK